MKITVKIIFVVCLVVSSSLSAFPKFEFSGEQHCIDISCGSESSYRSYSQERLIRAQTITTLSAINARVKKTQDAYANEWVLFDFGGENLMLLGEGHLGYFSADNLSELSAYAVKGESEQKAGQLLFPKKFWKQTTE